MYAYLSHIRRLFGDRDGSADECLMLDRRSGGYVLEIRPDLVDLHRFRRLVSGAGGRNGSFAITVVGLGFVAAVVVQAPVWVLGVLAAPALGMRLGMPGARVVDPGRTSRDGYELLVAGFGPGAAAPAPRLDMAGQPDRAPEQKQLFGQGRFSGIRVRDDGEGPARRRRGPAGPAPAAPARRWPATRSRAAP